MSSIKIQIFQPKYHYRIYIPQLKIKVLIPTDRKATAYWKANGAWHGSVTVHFRVTITCAVFSVRQPCSIQHSTSTRPRNNASSFPLLHVRDSWKTKASLKHRILVCWMFPVDFQKKQVISLKEQTKQIKMRVLSIRERRWWWRCVLTCLNITLLILKLQK
jgi:hypothetical protein